MPSSGSAVFHAFSLKDLFHFAWISTYVLGKSNGRCTAWWYIAWCVKHYSSFCFAAYLLCQVSVLVIRFIRWFLSPCVWFETPCKPMGILAKQYFQIKKHLKSHPNNLCWRHNSLLPSKNVMKAYSQIQYKHVLVLGRTHDNPDSWKTKPCCPS